MMKFSKQRSTLKYPKALHNYRNELHNSHIIRFIISLDIETMDHLIILLTGDPKEKLPEFYQAASILILQIYKL